MNTVSISSVTNRIVHHAFKERGGGILDEALYIAWDLRLSHFRTVGSQVQHRDLHLLYYRRPGGTYTSVFAATGGFRWQDLKGMPWKFLICHDSCWRDVDVFSKLYFEMAERINQRLVAAGHPEVAPADMSDHSGFMGLGDDMYRWVKVNVKRDPGDDGGYRQLVEVL